MIVTGLLILLFIVVHIVNFKVAYLHAEGGLYMIARQLFQQPLYVFYHVLSVGILGVHLSHGLLSACETLGWYHPRYIDALRRACLLFGGIVGAGFSVLPVFMFRK